LISGKWYYFFNGYMYSDGEYNIGNATYRFNKSGAMITGWYKYSDGDWSYYLSSGKLATGWQKIGGKWYYFGKYGWMENDCIKIIGGKGYKFAKSGYLMYANTTGWVKIYDGNGNLDYAYYVSSGGALTVGWKKIGGKWYYFDTYDCEMENDEWPRTINNKGYYFRSNGVMQGESGGWIKRDSYYWYYANKGGSLVTGWKKLNGKWYYFDASGAYNMYRGGTYKINQKSYTFNDNGVCKNK
jgi:glucan-binding YG repeat protein